MAARGVGGRRCNLRLKRRRTCREALEIRERSHINTELEKWPGVAAALAVLVAARGIGSRRRDLRLQRFRTCGQMSRIRMTSRSKVRWRW